MNLHLLSIFTFCLLSFSLNSQNVFRVASYNVENLFDLEDDPKHNDNDYLPTSKRAWNEEKYQTKLERIEQILVEMELPTLVGLQEVENAKVLSDLCAREALKAYDFIHYESKDYRGIDVALLYKKEDFKPIQSSVIPINFPEIIVKQPYTTRDILHVEGILNGSESIHIYVNHWPSRSGGLKKSEPKRLYVAAQLREDVNQVLGENPNTNILMLGDFNDEPDNNSVRTILGVLEEANFPIPGFLYDTFGKLNKEKKGSYNYRGTWNMLDHIIVSSALYDRADGVYIQNPTVFQREWMMYKDPKYGLKPNRTYGGPNYYGGYSDHLPVYLELVIEKN